MASTTCSVTTNVIASLGTTPEERGLTTDQFKAKFDQFATEFVAWFNATHIGTDKSHIGDNPAARVYHNAAQSIANATFTALAFNTERFDNDTIHDTSTNNSRLTCKTAGKYLIIGNITYAANATGVRNADIRLNGTNYIASSRIHASTAATVGVQVSAVCELNANDYVELMAYQSSGGALDVVSGASYSPEFSMVRVG